MTTINYQVRKTIDENRSVEIENEQFICIEHTVDGSKRITAFVGKGEGNNDKRTITISKSGGIFEIYKMAGDALLSAKTLLERDDSAKIVSNDYFKHLYSTQKERLVVSLANL